jgi:hypothetical protein
VTSAQSSVRSPTTAPIMSRDGPVVCFSLSARCRTRPISPPAKTATPTASAKLSGLMEFSY